MTLPTKEVSKYSEGISTTEVLSVDACSEAFLAADYFRKTLRCILDV